MEPVKLTCPKCGNGLFHCGLAGQPHWCGPAADAVAVCPKCGRRVARGVTSIDTSLKCPA